MTTLSQLPFGATATDDRGRQWVGGNDRGYQLGARNSPFRTTTPDDGMGGQRAADLIQKGGSGLSALAGALLATRANKKAKKIDKINREMKRKKYLDEVNDSLLEEGEGDRQFSHGLDDLRGVTGAAGLGESSARTYAIEGAEHEQGLRNWALRKQRADLKYGYEKGLQIEKLQKQIERINQQNAIITAAIDTASSAASMAVMCDREIKKDIHEVDPKEVLRAMLGVPIQTWRYEWEKDDVRHLGPMAQDWHDKLGFGNHHDGKKIDYVDAFGVALASIHGLAKIVAKQAQRISQLEKVVKENIGG